jgi:hypothetical protein
MLRFNSTNEVLPGGPVSSVSAEKEIFGDVATTTWAKTRSTIAGVGFFAGACETARRILQHSAPDRWGSGLFGLE